MRASLLGTVLVAAARLVCTSKSSKVMSLTCAISVLIMEVYLPPLAIGEASCFGNSDKIQSVTSLLLCIKHRLSSKPQKKLVTIEKLHSTFREDLCMSSDNTYHGLNLTTHRLERNCVCLMTILRHELNLATYVNRKPANTYSLKRQTIIT